MNRRSFLLGAAAVAMAATLPKVALGREVVAPAKAPQRPWTHGQNMMAACRAAAALGLLANETSASASDAWAATMAVAREMQALQPGLCYAIMSPRTWAAMGAEKPGFIPAAAKYQRNADRFGLLGDTAYCDGYLTIAVRDEVEDGRVWLYNSIVIQAAPGSTPSVPAKVLGLNLSESLYRAPGYVADIDIWFAHGVALVRVRGLDAAPGQFAKPWIA